MEIYFLLLLMVIMIAALSSGFPVAFALPGAAVATITIAALCGYLFAGDVDAYFVLGGPNQWLSAGVTNFRSLYWNVERDTLIAIPLFIFMGIMLQRSRIAQDLLVAMAQLFGPIPGGLGISVVFVGALLAATTGIVGATVIAMGLISLPAMMRHKYDPSLACGTICASGTLGQIIPPSIVLIILADQLSNAADQAATARKADYRESTGEFSMPGDFDVVSASAGDMFMGAFIPGLILVGLYMAYILIAALIKPKLAPPVPFEGNYDRKFLGRVLLALLPPLSLIFIVLGSIVLGVATVNQAGAIGAVGALIMASYRLFEGNKRAYYPAILAIASTLAILILLSQFSLNIKNISTDRDQFGVVLALIAVAGLLTAIVWSIYRVWKVDNTLNSVMKETAKTTSMVFIILIGAAMLTSAFRAFGGEELVKEYLSAISGGFWVQFIVVMLVIFLLGFFLDFIEIAVVVVPIVAPILLANPEANVTAVWLGVMIGLNIQTSFLTPPFGFALFYLRGVASKAIKTTHIYKGAVAFIGLQLLGLAIAGFFPSLVNYLPNKTHLTSETAPPPSNPRLQLCMEDDIFKLYKSDKIQLISAIARIKSIDVAYMPDSVKTTLNASYQAAESVFSKLEKITLAEQAVLEFTPQYQGIHSTVRAVQKQIRQLSKHNKKLAKEIRGLRYEDPIDENRITAIEQYIAANKQQKIALESELPDGWKAIRKQYRTLAKAELNARRQYRRHVDDSYQTLLDIEKTISGLDLLISVKPSIEALAAIINFENSKTAIEKIKAAANQLDVIANAHTIKSKLSKSRRALRGKNPDQAKALGLLNKALELLEQELVWRQQAKTDFMGPLASYKTSISQTIGARLQESLTEDQAESIARCLSVHKDISLNF